MGGAISQDCNSSARVSFTYCQLCIAVDKGSEVMLDFRMETFLTVCQCMNFTRASEKLNITQPAVSQHIHFLEEHYNTKLFRYEGKKLKLTGAGEILRNASLTMMHDEISMQNQMQKSEEEEEIRFGATRTRKRSVSGLPGQSATCSWAEFSSVICGNTRMQGYA